MVVVVHPQNIVSFAKSQGIEGDSPEHLVESKAFTDAVLKDLNNTGKQAGFRGMELLEAIVLTADEW